MFDVLEMSLTVMDLLAGLEAKVRLRRKSLADQIGRAAESIALNVSEGRERAGLDRADLYRRANRQCRRAHYRASHRAGARLHLAGRPRRRRCRARPRARDAMAAHALSARRAAGDRWATRAR